MNKIKIVLLASLMIPVFTWAQSPKIDTMAVINGVTAHRGYSAAYPENTLVAFKAAIDIHADWIELDIHKTKDGQIVISHNATTKRNGDQDLAIANYTYQELMQVDVATGFRKTNNLNLIQCPIQRMPLLTEALELIMKHKRTRVSIHPKVDCIAEAIAIVKTAKAENRVGFNSLSLPYMSAVKKVAQKIPVFWDRPAASDIDDDIKVAKEKGFETLVIHYDGITSEKIGKIHAANLKVGAWNVNDSAQMETLEKMGIDRIYADDPKLLIMVKKKLHKLYRN
jgi:glycerophosphoryl diester phosphodiesterase